ncbi:MAG TPA: hypothetical protein DC049_13555 [Spirochaetia bacterium]|nr:hypothetical protein [Spirochaetia bacterium]
MSVYRHLYTEEDHVFSVLFHDNKITKMPEVRKHMHSGYEIYFQIAGKRGYCIDEQFVNINSGSIVCIAPNTIHKTYNIKNCSFKRYYLFFSHAFIKPVLLLYQHTNLLSVFEKKYSILKPDKTVFSELISLLKTMTVIYDKKDNKSIDHMKCLTGQFLYLLSAQKTANISRLKKPMHEKINEIIKYINSQYHEQLSLKKIADGFFISPFYLSRLFRKETGFSMKTFINIIRIHEAQLLMREKQYSISRIASETGYESISYFDRAFKKISGVSPGVWKKNNL